MFAYHPYHSSDDTCVLNLSKWRLIFKDIAFLVLLEAACIGYPVQILVDLGRASQDRRHEISPKKHKKFLLLRFDWPYKHLSRHYKMFHLEWQSSKPSQKTSPNYEYLKKWGSKGISISQPGWSYIFLREGCRSGEGSGPTEGSPGWSYIFLKRVYYITCIWNVLE